MNLKTKLTLITVLFFNIVLIAQGGTVVKGTVISATDKFPIPGVNVIVANTSRGTSTDFDGQYELRVEPGDVLQFSYVGFETQSITVGDQTTIDVTLSENISKLDEIVVVAYGDQKQRNVTSALTKISSKDIFHGHKL